MDADAMYSELPLGSPERSLLVQARRGSLSAFDELVALHAPLVIRVATKLLGTVDRAQDVSQEVFLRLHRSLREIDEERDLAPWLYRVTVNASHDFLRRQKRDRHVGLDETPELSGGPDTPEEAWHRHQQRELLQRALAELSEKERTAIVLRDVEGLSTGEVAAMLGSSETTVRSQISVGRSKLRAWMERHLRRRQ